MHAALKLTATVLPGKRVEFTAPELPEGGEVELIVVLPDEQAEPRDPGRYADVVEFLSSLPDRHRTADEWAQIERELQAEKDTWER